MADEIAAAMFAQVAAQAGFPALTLPLSDSPAELIQEMGIEEGDTIIVSSVPPLALSHAKQTANELFSVLPNVSMVLGLWNYPMSSQKTLARIQTSVAAPVFATMTEALAYLVGPTA